MNVPVFSLSRLSSPLRDERWWRNSGKSAWASEPLTLAALQWKMLSKWVWPGLSFCFAQVAVSCFLGFDVRIQGLGDFLTLVCSRSSVLQASTLLSLLMAKMRTREKITLNRPLHPVLSPSLSTLEHSRANQTSIQTRQ